MASNDTLREQIAQKAQELMNRQNAALEEQSRVLEEQQEALKNQPQNEDTNAGSAEDSGSSGKSGDARSHSSEDPDALETVAGAMQGEPQNFLKEPEEYDAEDTDPHHVHYHDVFNGASGCHLTNRERLQKKLDTHGNTSFHTSYNREDKDEELKARKDFQNYVAVEAIARSATAAIQSSIEALGYLNDRNNAEIISAQESMNYSMDITRDLIENDETLRDIMREHGLDPDTYEGNILPDDIKEEYDNAVDKCTNLMTESRYAEDQQDITEKTAQTEQMMAYQAQLDDGSIKIEDVPEDVLAQIQDPQAQLEVARDKYIQEKYGMTTQEAYQVDPDSELGKEMGADIKEWEMQYYETSKTQNDTTATITTTTLTTNTTASSYASEVYGENPKELTAQVAFNDSADPNQPAPTNEPSPEGPVYNPATQPPQLGMA